MATKMWRPETWWNPFDYMEIHGDGMWIDVFINPETGEKMSDTDRQLYKKTIELGADMMLVALSGMRMDDVAKVLERSLSEWLGE